MPGDRSADGSPTPPSPDSGVDMRIARQAAADRALAYVAEMGELRRKAAEEDARHNHCGCDGELDGLRTELDRMRRERDDARNERKAYVAVCAGKRDEWESLAYSNARVANAVEIDSLRDVIRGVISSIECWKVPLLNPDGNDDSEAVMRLLADDLRKVLDD